MTTTRRGPGRPPKAEAGDTRAALFEAALQLFARKGYAGTSIRAIARAAGLSEGGLYAHYDSKQAIYAEAMQLAGPHAIASALSAVDVELAADPSAFVRAFAAELVSVWDTSQGRLMASFAARDGLIHDAAMNIGIEEAIAQLGSVFAGWLEEGQIGEQLGSALGSADAAGEDLAYALLAPIAHSRMLWLHADATPAQRRRARGRIDRHVELFVRAVFERC